MGIVMLPERCRGEWQWQAQTAMMVYDKGRLRVLSLVSLPHV